MFLPAASVTVLATTVTVQLLSNGRLVDGWSTERAAGEAGVTVKLGAAPGEQASMKVEPVTVTDLLKLIVIVLATGTLVAPLAGLVLVTVGGVSTTNDCGP